MRVFLVLFGVCVAMTTIQIIRHVKTIHTERKLLLPSDASQWSVTSSSVNKHGLVNGTQSDRVYSVFGGIPSAEVLLKHEILTQSYLKQIEELCYNPPTEQADLCPCDWSRLQGYKAPDITHQPSFKEIRRKNPEVTLGGVWFPPDCTPRHLVAIIIPFKNRTEHLKTFLAHIHPFLQRQGLGYRIIVVEQVYPKLFNKAAIMNVGFTMIQQLGHFDCVIFHDVDLLPEDDRHLYMCTSHRPGHLGYLVQKFNYTLIYPGLFGGVTAFTPTQFRMVNGFSNLFWGWGGEDDDMYNSMSRSVTLTSQLTNIVTMPTERDLEGGTYNIVNIMGVSMDCHSCTLAPITNHRVRARRYDVIRWPSAVATYTNIPHKRDNPVNHKNTIGYKLRPLHYLQDGLNSLRFIPESMEFHPLFTWIKARLPNHPYTGFSQH